MISNSNLSNLSRLTTGTIHISDSRTDFNSNVFISFLKSCKGASDLRKGSQVHAQIITNGIQDNALLSRVLGMYVLCENLSYAKYVFFRVDKHTALPWNWMIRLFTMMGMFNFALLFYLKMWMCGTLPDKYTYPYVIKSCCGLNALSFGRLIHDKICYLGLENDLFVGSSLIKMYAENNCIDDARKMFDKLPVKDSVLWNVMIDGYVRIGDKTHAFEIFNRMRTFGTRLNSVSILLVLSISSSEAMLNYGTQLHDLAMKCGVEHDTSVANTLLALYSKCRCLNEVSKLFNSMPHDDLVAWNGMISGYVQNGLHQEALDLFYRMQLSGVKPDSVTLCSFLPSFSDSASVNQGKEIHGYIVRNDVNMDAFLKSALIDIYLKSRNVALAEKVLESNREFDVVICSAMISGYVLNGLNHNALDMFQRLIRNKLKPNAITLASILPACSSLSAFRLGKEMHGYILKNTYEQRCYVSSALMDMYAKCGRLDLGHRIFVNIQEKDVVAWNTMISNLTQNGQPDEVLTLFREMGEAGISYDYVTISSALSVFANLPSLRYGKECHGFAIKLDLSSDLFVESALIDMYGKCGNLGLALRVFDTMKMKSEVSWNSIISAYGTYGLVDDAVKLYKQMEKDGFKADHITFLALLSACSHAGRIGDGIQIFNHMKEECNIAARMEHYACMVDMYGRAGRLDEALHLIMDMPFKADAGIWGTVLGACRVHGNIDIAEIASKHLFEVDPMNSGYYVIMSNINALAGKWDKVSRIRNLMRERSVQKIPGCSWINVGNVEHMFVSRDKRHHDAELIYSCIELLLFELEEEGYVPKPDVHMNHHDMLTEA